MVGTEKKYEIVFTKKYAKFIIYLFFIFNSEKRFEYNEIKKKHMLDLHNLIDVNDDNPLSQSKSSAWNQVFLTFLIKSSGVVHLVLELKNLMQI